jgi:hypothetical protein
VALAAVAAFAVLVATAVADTTVVKDRKNDTPALKKRPVLDIVRATAGHAGTERVKHTVTMRGRLKPNKANTRPLLLINTRGGPRSNFEYVVTGPRVMKRTADGYVKVGSNQVKTRKRTWIYRFDPASLGIGPDDSYGWAMYTSKGRASDLAPNNRYRVHDLTK